MRFIEALTPRRASIPELFRVAILVAASVAIMYPYLTGHLIGGVDGRWYGYMLADYIEQVRHGRFLVTVGQGEYAWNGSVHLFRSAPIYMLVARVWDFLTFRQLGPFALQHLTVVTSAAVGGVGFYASAVRFIPNRRWAALGLSLLYLGTPAWLSTVLRSEAYMSYMAFSALPLVLYGNARTALFPDGRGYIPLGAGLALVWMCHPPIAFLSTMVTLFLQTGLIMVRGVESWKNLLAGAAAFAVLGAFYFASMSELPRIDHADSMRAELVQIVGLSLFFAGAGRLALRPRVPGWAVCAALGALVIALTSRPWLCWIGASAAVWLLCIGGFRVTGRKDFERHAFVLLFLSALSGAAIAEAWVGRAGMFTPPLNILASNTASFMDWIRPLKTPMDRFQIFQPGFGLIAVFLLCVASLFGSRPPGAKLFFAAAVGLVICFFRVPLVSNFLLGRFPVDFIAMCGLPLDLRTAPLIASVTAMGGVVWLATATDHGRGARLATGALLGALVAWNGLQCVHFVRHDYTVIASASATDKSLRTENAMLDAYAYLLLPIPTYFSHGKTDPVLESRFLDASGKLRIGPMQDAAVMEAHGVTRIRLTCHPLPNSTTWFAVEPRITVEPGEHLLLRYEFDPARVYSGYMIFEAEHSYREYHLPDSGLEHSFGVGENRTSVLSFWNSGATPEHYKLTIAGEPGNNLVHEGGFFANLYVSKLDPSKLPIRLDSFLPYRAQVTTEQGGLLETFRVFMPGYRAALDGREVPVGVSRDHLVTVPVPPGVHTVELRFVGTARLWMTALVSGLGWAFFLIWPLVRVLRRKASAA